MKYYKNGFYEYPADGAVEIPDSYWEALLQGQSEGKEIVPDADGYPVLQSPGTAPSDSREEIRMAREAAYRQQTDPLKMDMDEAFARGDLPLYEKLKTAWIEGKDSIRNRCPYPETL